MSGRIAVYRTKLEQRRGKLKSLIDQQEKLETELATTVAQIKRAEEATAFTQRIAQETQNQVKIHIEDIVSMALESILDDPYKFELDFVLRRNKTEADIYFTRNGKRVKPMDESGGGAVDIASFAARIALWSLGTTDNVLVFDEPFKFVSREYQLKVGELMKKLSEKLKLQEIMVSHNSNFIQQADRVMDVHKTNNVSEVKVL